MIVGAGIAGASAGYHLSAHGRVIVLEMEAVAGFHATGRSAALFSEYYGPPVGRALTAASRAFLTDPPPGFAAHPLLSPRGTLVVCPHDDEAEAEFDRELAMGEYAPVPSHEVDPAEVTSYCPVLRPQWCRRAMLRPGSQDIDVDALHQGFLRGITAAGGRVVRRAPVRELRRQRDRWQVRTPVGTFTAPVVVNAAGAWADEVATLAGVRPVGLTPLRRTAFVVDAPPELDLTAWPLVADVGELFYFRPDAGQLLISPADATPSPPMDARPDDLDVALGARRVQEATTLRFRHIKRAWAGLRTVTPDGVPVIGYAPGHPGFHWLAGLGGYGVQTAPATGRLLAGLVTGTAGAEPGVDPTRLAADRFPAAT